MKWIESLIEKRRERKAKEAAWEKEFHRFVSQSRPMAPTAPKYPDASLYRHVWRRSAVLEQLAQRQNDTASAERYKHFQKLAAALYFPVAPENAYGTVPLKLTEEQAKRIAESELERLNPSAPPPAGRYPYACIYMGIDGSLRKTYIGQTIGEPEKRWWQHRAERTGPFKKGAKYVEWKIIKECKPNELDWYESYYIGYYNSVENGHNDNRGNSPSAYRKGELDRAKRSAR